MFDTLQEKLEGTFRGLGSKGRVTEADIDGAMREIRLALLEADVNFKVVRTFVATVKERLAGAEVHKALDAPQQIVKVVNEELVSLMGTGSSRLTFSQRGPTIILMTGLQGSGKTTTTAKLAKLLTEQDGKTPALVACDVYRPAAIDQLKTVGAQVGVPVYAQGTDADPVKIAEWGVKEATANGADVVIVDTAGRLDIDEKLMAELVAIKKAIKPHNVLLVLDAMTGQEAVSVAERFDEAISFDGVILTKLDGDARGGAALSVKEVVGRPIAFASTGEKLADFDLFHPDRLAGRILGMGDVLTLIEKAEGVYEKDEAEAAAAKLLEGEFTLDDFLEQMQQIKKMGPLQGLVGMLPGVPKELKNAEIDDREIGRIEAIIRSMTPAERASPVIIDASRRNRIAVGSGTQAKDVAQLVTQFREVQKMMKRMGGMGSKRTSKKGRKGKKGKGNRMPRGMPDLKALQAELEAGGVDGLPGLGQPGPGRAGGLPDLRTGPGLN